MRMRSLPVPVVSFASVVGIVALGLDWRAWGQNGSAAHAFGQFLTLVGAVVFLALLILLAIRTVDCPNEIAVEARSPITGSLFGTIVISISLLAAAALPRYISVATALWALATISGIGLVVILLARWMQHGIQSFELTPALFAPIVGNATTAFSGVTLGFVEISWLSYAIALLTWLVIGPLVFYRLLVVEPRLPRKMAPQLGLLVSSPAVLAASWFSLTGTADSVFKLLAFNALFLGLLVLRMWRIGWGEPFNVAMWGWTFPTAALAGVFGRAARALPDPFYCVLSWITLDIATVTVALCTFGAARGWLRWIVSIRAAAPVHDK